MGTNLRESLYQCLENEINFSDEQANHSLLLFKVSSTKNFAIRLYLSITSTKTSTMTDTGESLVQITFSNGEVCWGNDEEKLPFFKINQANIYKTGDAAITQVSFTREESNNIYSYYATVNSKNGVSLKVLARKEILFGEFEELLTKNSNGTTGATSIINVNKTINDTTNGQYVIGAEDITYAQKIVGKGAEAQITNFNTISSKNISVSNSIKLEDKFSIDANGNISGKGTLSVSGDSTFAAISGTTISATSDITSNESIIGKAIRLTDSANFNVSSSGEVSGSYIGINNTIPSANSNKLVREQDLAKVEALSNLTTVGTISTGTWNGSKISSSYIDDTLNKKTLVDPAIQIGTSTASEMTVLCTKDFNNDKLSVSETSVPSTKVVYNAITNVDSKITQNINNISTINTYLEKIFSYDETSKTLTITGKSSSST